MDYRPRAFHVICEPPHVTQLPFPLDGPRSGRSSPAGRPVPLISSCCQGFFAIIIVIASVPWLPSLAPRWFLYSGGKGRHLALLVPSFVEHTWQHPPSPQTWWHRPSFGVARPRHLGAHRGFSLTPIILTTISIAQLVTAIKEKKHDVYYIGR